MFMLKCKMPKIHQTTVAAFMIKYFHLKCKHGKAGGAYVNFPYKG